MVFDGRSKGDWGRYLALGLVVAFLATASTAQQKQPVTGQRAQGERVDDKTAAHQPQAAPPPATIQGAQDAQNTQAAAQAKANYDQANLEVQRRIADYTEQSVRMTAQALSFTRWAVSLTAIESLLFVVTTVFTIFAVKEARRSADIAEKALAQADRPYLVPDGFSVGDIRNPTPQTESLLHPPNASAFEWRVKNYGKGPAFTRRFFIGLTVHTETPDAPDYPYTWDFAITVSPGGNFGSDSVRKAFLTLSDEERAAILNSTKKLLLIGKVDYKGIAGVPHCTRFAYVFRPYNSPDADTFIPVDNPAYWENS